MDRDIAALRAASERLDGVLRELDGHPDPGVGTRVHDAVALLLELQGAGLQRVLALASDAALGGAALVNRLADDPIVGPLLVIHRLHPYAADVRVGRALDAMRPEIAAQGCRATLVTIEEGRARVRLDGGGRLASGDTLRQAIEVRLLDAAPELTAVLIEDGPGAHAATGAPLLQILRRPPSAAPAGSDR